MSYPHVVITSRRGRLLVQAAIVVGAGVVAAMFAESSAAVETSAAGRLGDQLGIPLVAIAVAGIAVALAFTLVRDSWSHQIVLTPDQLSVSDKVGHFSVPYTEIEAARQVPLGGIAIAFRNTETWLSSLETGQQLRRRTAHVLRRTYDCDILFPEKQLSVGSEQFLDLLRQRCSLK